MHTEKRTWKKWVAAGGGLGWMPFATGTWGSLGALLPLLVCYGCGDLSVHIVLLGMVTAGFALGVWLGNDLEREWGKDPKQFVWDEVIGQWLTLIGHALTWQNMALGFLLFRVFDIFKPLGIRRLERLHGGLGIMLDDMAAGVAANLCLWCVQYVVY